MLRFLEVLVEAKDLRPNLIKAGYSETMANWSHHKTDKLSGVMAKMVFGTPNVDFEAAVDGSDDGLSGHINQSIAGPRGAASDELLQVLREQNKPKLPSAPAKMSSQALFNMVHQWRIIRDWCQHPEVAPEISIQQIPWEEAYQTAQTWHEERVATEGAMELTAGQEKVVDFDDGSYWLRLNTEFCRDEGDAMGHCGRAEHGELFSLRTAQGVPKLTADLNANNHSCGQIYGRGNSKPKEKYHKKILALLGHYEVETLKSTNYGEQSLHVDDFSPEDLQEYENETGIELTSTGVTQAQIDEAQEVFNQPQEGPLWVNADLSGGEEYTSAYIGGEFSFPVTLTGSALSSERYGGLSWEFTREFDSVFSMENTEYAYSEGNLSVRVDQSVGYFDMDTGSGSMDGDYQGYDDIVSWAKECMDAARWYDQYEDGKLYTQLLQALIKQNAVDVHADPFTYLWHLIVEDDGTSLSLINLGDISRYNDPEPKWRITLELTIYGVGGPLQYSTNHSREELIRLEKECKRKINKSGIVNKLIFKADPPPEFEQMELPLKYESILEEAAAQNMFVCTNFHSSATFRGTFIGGKEMLDYLGNTLKPLVEEDSPLNGEIGEAIRAIAGTETDHYPANTDLQQYVRRQARNTDYTSASDFVESLLRSSDASSGDKKEESQDSQKNWVDHEDVAQHNLNPQP